MLIALSFTMQYVQGHEDPGYDDPYEWIVGFKYVDLTGESVGVSYQLWPAHIPYALPVGGRYEWSIFGNRGYISSANGSYCSVTFYAKGYYRLLCDVYDAKGDRIDGITKYITVR